MADRSGGHGKPGWEISSEVIPCAVALGVGEPEVDVGPAAGVHRLDRVLDAGGRGLEVLVELAELLAADLHDELVLVAGLEQQPGGCLQDVGTQALSLPPAGTPARGGRAARGRGRQVLVTSATRLGTSSRKPMRSCSRRSGRGAHQLALPARRMNAGTSSARIRVASTTIASALPIPNSFRKVTCEVAKAMNTIASSAARVVTMRPLRSRPVATDEIVSPLRSYSSLIRESRKTS